MKELTRKEEQVLLAVHHLGEEACLIAVCEQVFHYTGKRYSPGTVYAPLSRLHGNGFIESRTGRNPDSLSKKPVRFYRLTKKGRAALVELQRSYRTLWSGFTAPAEGKVR